MSYRYDMRLGHYVPINEGENPQENNQEQNTQDQNNENKETEDKAFLTNLETDDVQKLKQEKENKLKDLQTRINTKNSNILQLQTKINDSLKNNKQPDANAAQKQLLQAKKELSDLNFEVAKIQHDSDSKIFQVQLSLVESIITDQYPTRYQHLNEEMIERSKIYLDPLFESDYWETVSEMKDFKKIMGNANMLYGRDDKGYFAVCIDQFDLNKLQIVLEKAGFNRDSILGCCLSQIYL